ncbi:GDSL-like protein [Aeromicrobium marinum DSM 15272]|uniref:GDSL-like protein n=1 Tax=Aeromicrobium marinum DSM 15272 TaxID=585531 RepID=E2SBJ6_9ACTN|nr:SGNH/GDSL hydrolase family protein [Aeromicrobium marinum]EFQ83742.1 GDSL-like protein [Aeromicrobium marinum DSM 15272]
MGMRRKIATATAVGTVATVGTTAGFLFGETVLARRLIGVTDARPPSPDGLYGDDQPGETIRAVVLGDSAAVGYGMLTALTTPPALLGYGLAQRLASPVQMHSVAVVGAESSDLAEQVDRALPLAADVAVIVIGANDVTHLKSARDAAYDLSLAVTRLVEAGTAVVVGTCPDLGTVRPIKEPLRSVARLSSRRLARKQTVAAVQAGARTVSLGGLLGPIFIQHHELMFGDDRFHPSASGYASLVTALLSSVADAVHERRSEPVEDDAPSQVMPVDEAADLATHRDGTEVRGAGRWAGVLRRRR